ncbi:hypothetical protein [Frankia sp. Cj5]|nr:hypothetical protein [Frankia sp. Cj5]
MPRLLMQPGSAFTVGQSVQITRYQAGRNRRAMIPASLAPSGVHLADD